MDEILKLARKSFSKIGWIFFILSLLVTFIQVILMEPVQFYFGSANLEAQVLASTGILYIVGCAVLLYSARRFPGVKPAKKKMSVLELLKAFIMCYTLMIFANILGLLLTGVIGAITGSPVYNPVEEIVTSMSIPLMFVTTVVCAPIFEELFFRKFIIDRLVKYGEVTALMVSGLMFGLFHGNLSQFPYAFALGAFFGFIYIRTGQIMYPIILHAVINFMGSIVSGLLLKMINLDLLMKVFDTDLQQSSTLLVKQIMDNFDGIVLYLLYEMIILVLVVVGIILWIFNFKKFTAKPAEEELPKGKRFSVSILNKGMIAYSVLWIITIIISALPTQGM